MKQSGLERKVWHEAIDEFVRQHGRAKPRWAILCSYEIDLKPLNSIVLPLLSRRGRVFRTVVLCDAGTLEQKLKVLNGEMIGAVNLHKVYPKKKGSIFHPKLACLRAGPYVRVCFGSANLTDGGFGSNLEIWTFSEDSEIVSGVLDFLRRLPKNVVMDEAAARSINRAIAGTGIVPCRTPAVWSSLDESFASHIQKSPDRSARRAGVISPLYATEGGLKRARAVIPASEIQICTNVPVKVPNSSVSVYEPPHIADQIEDEFEAWPRELHAKAYLFRHRDKTACWIGSANFTAQALTKSVAQGGNVELLVRVELPKDEVDAFDADLKKLFKKTDETFVQRILPPFAAPLAVATVLGCELVGSETAPRLIVYSIQEKGSVVLENRKRRVLVAVKNGQGSLSGRGLRRLIPNLDLTVARPIVLYQIVRGKRFPVVVNVPHVPPEVGVDSTSQASLDALLDDLMGTIRVWRRTDNGNNNDTDEDVDPSEYTNSDEDRDDKDFERRLDEVKHQGEIDRLAVKAALLKKLVTRATMPGRPRKVMLVEALNTLLKACPRHFARAIQALFQGIDTERG